jgi:hypothetical protein
MGKIRIAGINCLRSVGPATLLETAKRSRWARLERLREPRFQELSQLGGRLEFRDRLQFLER